MSKNSWSILSEETVFEAKPFLRVTRQWVRTEHGQDIPTYYQVILPDFAVICPFTVEGQVITIWQYKHGARRYGMTFPAGVCSQDEAPEKTAERELLEETGYVASQLRFLGRYASTGNQGCGFAHMYSASGCRRVQEPSSGDLESMDVRVMSVADVQRSIHGEDVCSLAHLAIWGLVLVGGLPTMSECETRS